jgi:hypothetical protein
MGVMKKPKRPGRLRTLQRTLARVQEKLAGTREKLAAMEDGGTPEFPLEVESASLVELRAEALPCLRCESAMRCEEHTAESFEGESLRVVKLQCRSCGARREVYFRIRPKLLN